MNLQVLVLRDGVKIRAGDLFWYNQCTASSSYLVKLGDTLIRAEFLRREVHPGANLQAC